MREDRAPHAWCCASVWATAGQRSSAELASVPRDAESSGSLGRAGGQPGPGEQADPKGQMRWWGEPHKTERSEGQVLEGNQRTVRAAGSSAECAG